jgi:hypothetical protein
MEHIVYNTVSQINLHEVIAHLKAGNDVELHYVNKDILSVFKDSGNYAQIGHVDHLTVSYDEYDSELDGLYSVQREYFAIDDYETAALAFLKRATYEGHKSTNTGKTLEQLAGKDAATIHIDYMTKIDGGDSRGVEDDPLEQASHALICGTDPEMNVQDEDEEDEEDDGDF